MSDNTKNPNPRNLGDYEEGLDDDLDVPTYRRIADDGVAASGDAQTEAIAAPAAEPALDDDHVDPVPIAPHEEADATQVMSSRDIYAAAGRSAPQKIEPLATADDYREADADFASDVDQPTQVAPAATGYDDVGGVGAVGTAGTAGAVGADDEPLLAEGAYATASHDRDFRDDDQVDGDLDPRRGTLDFGLLLLRLGVGAMLLMMGVATFFQLGGAPGIGALEARFIDNGYDYAGIFAVTIPTVLVVSGGLLVFGLATPLGAALALAMSAFLTMFEVAVGDSGWNVVAAGAEPVRLYLVLTVAALALQFTGPGRYGIDVSRGWARRPLASSWIFGLLAIAAAIGLWYLTAGQLPFIDTTTGATAQG